MFTRFIQTSKKITPGFWLDHLCFSFSFWRTAYVLVHRFITPGLSTAVFHTFWIAANNMLYIRTQNQRCVRLSGISWHCPSLHDSIVCNRQKSAPASLLFFMPFSVSIFMPNGSDDVVVQQILLTANKLMWMSYFDVTLPFEWQEKLSPSSSFIAGAPAYVWVYNYLFVPAERFPFQALKRTNANRFTAGTKPCQRIILKG